MMNGARSAAVASNISTEIKTVELWCSFKRPKDREPNPKENVYSPMQVAYTVKVLP